MTLISYQIIGSFLEFGVTNLYINFSLLFIFICKSIILTINFLTINFLTKPLPGLANSLANIHPILIIIMFGNFLVKRNIKSVLVFWFILVLGGWWASQEFNWGGWWNWDLIETPALTLSIFILSIYHKTFTNTYLCLRLNIWKLFLIILVLCINTRYMGSNSIHSFISSTQFFEYYYIILYSPSLNGFILMLLNYLSVSNLNSIQFIICFYTISMLNYSLKFSLYKSCSHHKYIYVLVNIYLLFKLNSIVSCYIKPNLNLVYVLEYSSFYLYGTFFSNIWVKEIVFNF